MHEEELEKLETEKRLEMTKLELLKSQINPHFLFNTLNVIGGMASLEEAETTEKMIRALSALFRYNLKNQDTEVCLSQELKLWKIICICSRCVSETESHTERIAAWMQIKSLFRHLHFSRWWKMPSFMDFRKRRRWDCPGTYLAERWIYVYYHWG